MAGMDIYTLSRILGHGSVTVTERAYLDLTDEDLKRRYRSFSPMEHLAYPSLRILRLEVLLTASDGGRRRCAGPRLASSVSVQDVFSRAVMVAVGSPSPSDSVPV